MLTELRIKNFAIIESLTLPLAPGFNVLSGETGAGKSIIVGALGMLLGERANADMIRTGADRATVEGTFEVAKDTPVAKLLDERGFEVEDGVVVLKREVAGSGRGRAWINGTSVTAAVLAEMGRRHRRAVDPGPAPARPGDLTLEDDDSVFDLEPSLVEQLGDWSVLRHFKGALDRGPVGAGSNHVRVRPLAQQHSERADDDRLSRPRFS